MLAIQRDSKCKFLYFLVILYLQLVPDRCRLVQFWFKDWDWVINDRRDVLVLCLHSGGCHKKKSKQIRSRNDALFVSLLRQIDGSDRQMCVFTLGHPVFTGRRIYELRWLNLKMRGRQKGVCRLTSGSLVSPWAHSCLCIVVAPLLFL